MVLIEEIKIHSSVWDYIDPFKGSIPCWQIQLCKRDDWKEFHS